MEEGIFPRKLVFDCGNGEVRELCAMKRQRGRLYWCTWGETTRWSSSFFIQWVNTHRKESQLSNARK